LVGNHLSYLDIPLLMQSSPNISFVAKEEVGRWPVIGAGAHALNTIFVKRSPGR
jgi:1-acyl-sn-glycerol-3-phosphate acyltransferase